MVDVEALIDFRGVTNIKGVTYTEGAVDVESTIGDVDARVGNAEVTFMDMAGGMEVGIPNIGWPNELQ
ncbi:hypothetical protein KI387_036459, partial [Taxus chinensis]